jgi:hypothetical protein
LIRELHVGEDLRALAGSKDLEELWRMRNNAVSEEINEKGGT